MRRLVEYEDMTQTGFMMKIFFCLKLAAVLKNGKVKSFMNLKVNMVYSIGELVGFAETESKGSLAKKHQLHFIYSRLMS